jgi:hypothetical protein
MLLRKKRMRSESSMDHDNDENGWQILQIADLSPDPEEYYFQRETEVRLRNAIGRLPSPLRGANLSNSWVAFLGYAWTPWIFSIAAIGELINDKFARAIIGTIAGMLGAGAVRVRLDNAFGKDLPAALLEDVVAIVGAIVIVWGI